MSASNLEEAAAIASEFISSLDSLPSEVRHLLQEIQVKEKRLQELQQQIARDCNRYTRHALRQSSPTTPVPPSPQSPLGDAPQNGSKNGVPPETPVTGAAEAKDQALLPKIDSAYVEVDRLAAEKIALAQRLVSLLMRARARLDVELAKVSILQGDVPGLDGATTLPVVGGPILGPVAQITESLKIALSPSTASGDSSPIGAASQKRRKFGAQGSLKLGSGAHSRLPTPTPPVHAASGSSSAPYARSRLSQQVHLRGAGRRGAVTAAAAAGAADKEDEDLDMDAEGEDDEEAEGAEEEAEDKGIYCICQEMSHGEMIACDNPDCPYQWFHITCVNVKAPLPDIYYCAECTSKGFGVDNPGVAEPLTPMTTASATTSASAAVGRKGRRK